jgi:hypothetical protein
MLLRALSVLAALAVVAALSWRWTHAAEREASTLATPSTEPAAADQSAGAVLGHEDPSPTLAEGRAEGDRSQGVVAGDSPSGRAEVALDRWIEQRLDVESILAPLAALIVDRLEAEGARYEMLYEGQYAATDLERPGATTVVRQGAAGARLYAVDHVRFPAFAELEARVRGRDRRPPWVTDRALPWHEDAAFVSILRRLARDLDERMPSAQ